MENILKSIKGSIRSVVRKIFLRIEDNPSNPQDTDTADLGSLEIRLSNLENELKRLNYLQQLVANLQTKVDKLPTATNNTNPQQPVAQRSKQSIKNEHLQSKPTVLPTIETYFVRRMGTNGNIEIRNKIDKSEALFELVVLDNKAELRPLSEQSAYLILQQKYLLEPVFNVSGSGQLINCIKPAEYELQENVWTIKIKGNVNLL